MELTKIRKNYIDSLSHYHLLSKWRFAPNGDEWMQGETGKYWGERMAKLRDEDHAQAVRNSKEMGWG